MATLPILALLLAHQLSASLPTGPVLHSPQNGGGAVGQFGQYQIDDYIACVIRDEARKANVPDHIAMGIAGAESGWDPNALGDQVPGSTVVVGGTTYYPYHDPGSGRYYSSLGLFQLNICGGQGSGHSPADCLNPRLNAQIAMGPIAAAYFWGLDHGYSGWDLVAQVAIHSGHPGHVDPNDPRVRRIVDITSKLVFNPDVTWASWPTFNAAACSGLPPPPPPLDTWSEGAAPTNRDEADDAVSRHAERIGELVDMF